MFKDTLLKFLNLEGLISNLTGYIETRVELLKIEVKEDLAKTVAKLVVVLTVALAGLFFLLFMSVAGAYWLGKSLGMIRGFAIVAGFYGLVMIILLLFRKNITKELEKKFLQVIEEKKKYGNA